MTSRKERNLQPPDFPSHGKLFGCGRAPGGGRFSAGKAGLWKASGCRDRLLGGSASPSQHPLSVQLFSHTHMTPFLAARGKKLSATDREGEITALWQGKGRSHGPREVDWVGGRAGKKRTGAHWLNDGLHLSVWVSSEDSR